MPRRRRAPLTIAAVAVVAVIALIVSQAAGEEQITGSHAARIGLAALEVTGGGQVVSIERSDDVGEAWEVEVRRASTEVDVRLDARLDVVGSEAEIERELGDDFEDDERDGQVRELEEGEPPFGRERRRVTRAALRHAGGGTIESVERSDDPGEAYEVEVVLRGREVDIALDRRLRAVPNVRYDD